MTRVGGANVKIHEDGKVSVDYWADSLTGDEGRVLWMLWFPDTLAAAEHADRIFNNKSLVANSIAQDIMRVVLGTPGVPVGWHGWEH